MIKVRLITIFLLVFTLYQLNKVYAAVSFDGVDDVIDCTSDSRLDDLQPFSISAWIFPKSLGEGGFGRIVVKDSSGAGQWQLIVNTSNTFRFTKDFDGVNDLQTNSASNEVVLNDWQHIVLTWDGTGTSSTGVVFYVDGLVSAHGADTNGDGSAVSDASLSLKIGNNPAGARTFDGYITEVAIWNKVLSQTEVNQLSNLNFMRVKGSAFMVSPANLVAYWPLDDCPDTAGCATNFIDRGKNRIDGTPSNYPTGLGEKILSYP